MKLSEKLRLLRIEKGKTQQEVSDTLGIGITTLRNYENDKLDRMPNTYQLKQLKDYYNVTYEYLLDEECENKSLDTINIGKELNFSDKSITKIKNLEEDSKYLNYIFEKIDLKKYIELFKKFYTINHIITYDMFRLIYICDLRDYIIDRVKNEKTADLEDYFNECNKSINNIMNFVYSKNNLFFSPSDSAYDLFEESYINLTNCIFHNENKDDFKTKKENIIDSLEDFCDLHEEVYYKMKQFKKLILIDINEFNDNLFKNIDKSDRNTFYKKIMGSYINHINKGIFS